MPNFFIGTYNQTMDIKGRMTFPAKLREIIGETFIVTRGIDGCLFAYDTDTFNVKAQKISQLPISKARALQRSFMGSACEVTADKQGRILLPANLRELADLKKDIIVVGASDRCEIWDKKRWEVYDSGCDDEKLMNELEDIGF